MVNPAKTCRTASLSHSPPPRDSGSVQFLGILGTLEDLPRLGVNVVVVGGGGWLHWLSPCCTGFFIKSMVYNLVRSDYRGFNSLLFYGFCKLPKILLEKTVILNQIICSNTPYTLGASAPAPNLGESQAFKALQSAPG